MPRYRIQNIDRKTNKPELKNSESTRPDPILNRANQVRRDDDVVRTPKRTVYDIDYAIKWFLDNEIQPQVEANGELIQVPVIFAAGENSWVICRPAPEGCAEWFLLPLGCKSTMCSPRQKISIIPENVNT